MEIQSSLPDHSIRFSNAIPEKLEEIEGSIALATIETRFGKIKSELRTQNHPLLKKRYDEQSDRRRNNVEENVIILGKVDDQGNAFVIPLQEAIDSGYVCLKMNLYDPPNGINPENVQALLFQNDNNKVYQGQFPIANPDGSYNAYAWKPLNDTNQKFISDEYGLFTDLNSLKQLNIELGVKSN